jgi:hypothetical protein
MGENLYAISPAVILSHAARLASLVECTPAHVQCVALTAREPPRRRLAQSNPSSAQSFNAADW